MTQQTDDKKPQPAPAAQPAAAKPKPVAQLKPPKKIPVKDPSVLMQVEGLDGQVILKADRVIIARRGLFNLLVYGFSAQREIPLTAIAEVIFKNANLLQPGHIEFVVAGRGHTLEISKIKHNAVKFKAARQDQFLKIKERVFVLMNQSQQKPR